MSHIRVNTSNAKVRHIDGAELVQSFFGNPSRGDSMGSSPFKKEPFKTNFSLSFLKAHCIADVVFTI